MIKKIIITLAIFGAASMFAEEAAPAPQVATAQAPASEKKDDKKFEINARVQARAVMGQSKSGYAKETDFDTVDFNLRRIRLTAKYEAAPWAGGVIDIKGENLVKLSSSPLTAIGAIQEANIWLKPGLLGSVIKIGQFKIPFLREHLTSSADMVVNERAFSEKAIQQMDIGLLLQLQPLELISDSWGKKLDLAFSVTNGDGSGQDGVGIKNGEITSSNTSIAKLINWRVQVNPFGGIMKDGKETSWKDGMEIFQENAVLWSIGAAGAYSNGSEAGLFVADKSFSGHTFDTTFTAFGIYVNGEFTMFSGNAVALGYTSYQATLGYNLKLGPVYLMPVVRYNSQSYDKSDDGVIDDKEKLGSIWIGANLFAMKHDLKLQVFYNLASDATGTAINKDVLYFQVQTNIGKKI